MNTCARRLRPWALGALLLAFPAPGNAAEEMSRGAYFSTPEAFYPDADYDPSIPTFPEVMGFQPGEWFVSPVQAETYLQRLEAASDRVQLQTYGRTYEGRPLLLAVISSPANLTRLDGIRADLSRLRNPEGPSGDAERDALVERTPVVVWLAYSVHGDEHSGTEAALMTVHHLAADRSAETRAWLDGVVVLIDPMQNPDGRNRFLAWQEATVARDREGQPRPNPGPEAIEHREPWPGGRFNHYLFDLNRDWFFLTQAESLARVQAFRDWYPHVFVDLHEMETNATYFFPPPTAPINPYIPDVLRRWWEIFGAGNARMLDRFGVDYYTREHFDAFYPGYGDSFPTLNGAVGMTYEQASAGGLAQKRRDGTVITLRQAAWHHFLTSLATIQTANRHRQERQRDYARFFEEAVRGDDGPREYWVVPRDGRGGTGELAALLEKLGIRVEYPAGRVTNDSLRPLVGDEEPPEALPEGGFLIPLRQPQRRVVQTLLETEVSLDEDFLREEEEKRRRREPDGFYDITAWSVPLAYGVQAFAAAHASSGPTTGDRPAPHSGVDGAEDAVAFLLRYDGNDSASALVELLSSKPSLRVQVSLEEFRAGGADFPRGTLVLKARRNPADLVSRLRDVAARHGVTFQGVPSAMTESGIDLGSDRIRPLRFPRIGLLFGPPASAPSTGWLWYLLEQRFGVDITRLRPEDLVRTRLLDLDVLIFPDSDVLGSGYLDLLGADGVDRLRRWIESGGVFVGMGGGAALATRSEVGWTDVRLVTQPDRVGRANRGRGTSSQDEAPPLRVEDLPDPTPGAIARVQLDPHHFLSLGYGDWLAVPVISRLAFTSAGEGLDAAWFDDAAGLRLSGFMWDETREALAGNSYVLSEKLGEGKVILFAGDPVFRAYWPNLNRLLLNAILLAPSL